MKLSSTIPLFALLVAAGCRESQDKSAASHEAPALAPQFSAKNGLLLPGSTCQALDLKIVEVGEQKLSATLSIQLRVYEQVRSGLRAVALLTPEQAKGLKRGQPIEVQIRDGQTLVGKVTAVNEQMQKATGQVEVLVEIPEAGGALEVGTFVSGSVVEASERTVLCVPRTALLTCSEGQFVYTVSGEHLVRTAVKVGATNSEWVEIADGLYAGDRVAAQPVMSLWLTELAAVKGGQACCIEPPKGK